MDSDQVGQREMGLMGQLSALEDMVAVFQEPLLCDRESNSDIDSASSKSNNADNVRKDNEEGGYSMSSGMIQTSEHACS